jgi:hypothetical protein
VGTKHQDDLYAAPLGDLPERLIHRRVALDAMAVYAQPRNRQVSSVSHVLELGDEVWVDAEEAVPPASDSGEAAVGLATLDVHE